MNHAKLDEVSKARPVSDTEVLTAVAKMLKARVKSMGAALDQPDYPHAKGTPERAWHSGYVSAMQDTLRMIVDREGEYPMVMEVGKHPDE